MIKLFCATAMFLLSVQFAFSQPITFERYYDFGTEGHVEQAYCIDATADGGYIMCGRQGQVGTTLLLLVKVDSAGILEWHKTYGFGGGWAWGYSIKQTPDLGYVVTGLCTDANGYNILMARCDQNGDTLWSKKYDPWIYGIRAGVDVAWTDSGYTILANSVYQVDTLYSAQLLFIDSVGNLLQQKVFTKGFGISPCRFKHTTDGGFIIANYTNPSTNDNDIYLIKTDADGDTLWTKTIMHLLGYSFVLHYSNCINPTTDGGFIVTGTAYNSSLIPQHRVLLIKIDEFGDTLWTKQIPSPNDLWGDAGSVQTSDGGFMIAGFDDTLDDVYFLKADDEGNPLWHQTYGGSIADFPSYLIATTDGGFAVCGLENSWGDGGGVYLIKTDSLGYAQSYITDVTHQAVASSSSLTLYPNPSNGNLIIQSSDAWKGSTIYITDVLGRVVFKSTPSSNQVQININCLGLYVLTVFSTEGQVLGREKLFVQ